MEHAWKISNGKTGLPLTTSTETGVDIEERRLGSSSPDPLRQDSVCNDVCERLVPILYRWPGSGGWGVGGGGYSL